MPIAQDRADYFWLAANDPVTPEMPEPETFQNSKVTPLIDLKEYADKLNSALATIGQSPDPSQNQGDFFYISGWWLGLLGGPLNRPQSGFDSTGYSFRDVPAFNLDSANPANAKLIDILKQKAQRGVDVRVMGWISYSIMTDRPHPLLWVFPPLQTAVANSLHASNAGIASMGKINAQTMNSIKELRTEPMLAKKCLLNILGHSAGAVHIKGCIVGKKPPAGNAQAIAFTGGIDFEQQRWADYGHELVPVLATAPHPGWAPAVPVPYWHDVQAAIEGPGAQGFYNHYLQMWNEVLARDTQEFRFEGGSLKSRVSGTPNISSITIDASVLAASPMTHHVQSLRTIPAFNYHWYNCLPEGQAASFAPNGVFEVRAAWRKAIMSAERYIYIEDQSFSSREIMEWINARIAQRPNLRVIFVRPGSGDPNDAPTDTSEIDAEAFNRGLLGIGPNAAPSIALTPNQRNQARLFRVWGESIMLHDNTGTVFAAQVLTEDTSVPNEVHVTLTGVNAGAEALPANILLRQLTYLQAPGGSRRILGHAATPAGQPVVLRLEDTGVSAPIANGDIVQFFKTFGIVVHSKITIIDDKWAMIGSANAMRRSLYTDWEHSVSFLDESETGVKEFRKRIWAEHFNRPNTPAGADTMDDIDDAIAHWDSANPFWNPASVLTTQPSRNLGDSGPDYIQRIPLPVADRPLSDDTRAQYDGYLDPDSRENWGGLCKP